MSLDVRLDGPAIAMPCFCRCGNEHTTTQRQSLFDSNITHNLNTMAEAAGIYQHLWSPEGIGITKASELVGPLRAGLAMMKADPAYFRALDAPNGWGRYVDFVPWVEEYLCACEKHPDAIVSVSR